MDFAELKKSDGFRELIMDADYQARRADVALRANRPQTARKHVLSALAWLAEAQNHELADKRTEMIESVLKKVDDAFDRLRSTDRFTIMMKVNFIRAIGSLFGAKRALPFIQSWQKVHYGR